MNTDPQPELFFYSPSAGGFFLRSLHGSAVPDDAVEVTEYEHRALMDGQLKGLQIVAGNDGRPALIDPASIPLTPEQLKKNIIDLTQTRLDAFAQSKGYDNILSACTYATSRVPKFWIEGQYCVDARDLTWGTLINLLAQIEAGEKPIPSGFADIESELPPLVWPTEPA